MVWEDKSEEIADQCERELPVLTEDVSKEIKLDPSKPTNFIFEGDNYHTLYTLDFTHKKKIDVIYIDPPFKETVTEFITAEAEKFVRFHNGISNINRPWIMKASDVQHLTETQIRNKFSSLPGNPIPKISYVDIPAGTKLYSGSANGLYGFDGGGLQFYIDKVQFGNNPIPSAWFSPSIDIFEFLN